jgi:hypothetical protein
LLFAVNSKPRPKIGTTQQVVSRFEELYSKMQRTKSLTKKSAFLHMLLQLSNDPKVVSSDDSVDGADSALNPAQGSVIESVFVSKLAN